MGKRVRNDGCINGKHFNIEHLMKIADVLEVDVCKFFENYT